MNTRRCCLLVLILLWTPLLLPGRVRAEDDRPAGQPRPEPVEPAASTAELETRALEAFREGRYGEAAALLDQRVSRQQKALGPEHPDVAATLTRLAKAERRGGLYDKARLHAERALALRERVLGPDHPDVAASLDELGLVLLDLGQADVARPLLERALEIRARTHGAAHPDVAASLDHLARVLAALGEPEAALPLAERALAQRERLGGPAHVDVATSLQTVGRVLRAAGRRAEAHVNLERALAILRKVLGPSHPEVALLLADLARLQLDMGETDRARSTAAQALEIAGKTLGADHPDTVRITEIVASSAKAGEATAQSPELSKRVLSGVQDSLLRFLGGLPERDRISLARTVRSSLSSTLTRLLETEGAGYEAALALKGVVSREGANDRWLARHRKGDALDECIRDVEQADRRLSSLANAMPVRFEKQAFIAWQEAYATAAGKAEQANSALTRRLAPLRRETPATAVALADIEAQLGPSAILLDFMRIGERFFAWVVSAKGPVAGHDLGPADEIEEAATTFAKLTVECRTQKGREAWLEAGRQLRDLVLEPLFTGGLPDTRTVYVSPDAALSAVSFAALPGRPEDRLLIDDHVLVYLAHASDLVPRREPPATGQGALLVGDPDYAHRSASAGEADAPHGRPFMPLPEAAREVESVKTMLGEEATLLTGPEATEASFRTDARGKRVLHVATHAFVREDLRRGLRRRPSEQRWLGADRERQLARGHDPLLLSGLALTGASSRDGGGGDDGILTALEASHLDLDGADLVVLSTVNAARGIVEPGEGVFGLVRGFQMAGARQVLGSLGCVDDRAARLLMERFYTHWNPTGDGERPSVAEALRLAQLDLRAWASDEGKQRGYEHPFYWATWVVWGGPRSN